MEEKISYGGEASISIGGAAGLYELSQGAYTYAGQRMAGRRAPARRGGRDLRDRNRIGGRLPVLVS